MARSGELLVVLSVALLAAACGAGGPRGIRPTGPAVIAPQCSAVEGTPVANAPCRSPDRRWLLTWRGKGSRCSLFLTRGSAGRRVRVFETTAAPCSYLTWVKPHLLLFDDDYRVMTLHPSSRQVTSIGRFSDFLVSPDQRWIAGYAASSPEQAETVDLLSLNGRTCLVVPHTSHQTDEVAGFTRDSEGVIVLRARFTPNDGPTGPSHLVQYDIASLQRGSAQTGC